MNRRISKPSRRSGSCLISVALRARVRAYCSQKSSLTGIIDNANRRFFHRYIKTREMRHLIAPFIDARGRTDLDPFIIIEGDARSA